MDWDINWWLQNQRQFNSLLLDPLQGAGSKKKLIFLRRLLLLFLDCRCRPWRWRWRRGSVACNTWHTLFSALFSGDVGRACFPSCLLLFILCVFSLFWINLRSRRRGYRLWYNLLGSFVFFFFLEDIGLEKLSIECYATEWRISWTWTK